MNNEDAEMKMNTILINCKVSMKWVAYNEYAQCNYRKDQASCCLLKKSNNTDELLKLAKYVKLTLKKTKYHYKQANIGVCGLFCIHCTMEKNST